MSDHVPTVSERGHWPEESGRNQRLFDEREAHAGLIGDAELDSPRGAGMRFRTTRACTRCRSMTHIDLRVRGDLACPASWEALGQCRRSRPLT